jgi:uncharacterized SAM-binding protein YcdF (DUF218 family)
MDTVFFIAAKLLGALLRADTWLVFALAAVIYALLRRKPRTALWITTSTFLAVVALAVFPLGGEMLARIEQTYPANPALDRVDGIILLGGGEDVPVTQRWQQPQLGEGGDRYTAALALAKQFPQAVVVFAGGSGALRNAFGAPISEAEIAREFFRAQGIADHRVQIEGQSRNTAENALLSFEQMQPKPDTKWVLVTSAFHMPRAMRSFETAGWPNLTAYPVDYRTASFSDYTGWNFERNLRNLNIAIRERVGQIVYQVANR